MHIRRLFGVVCSVTLACVSACGSAGTSTSNPTADNTTFPSDLAIVSPTSTGEADANLAASTKSVSLTKTTAFDAETEDIKAILDATTLAGCDPDFSGLMYGNTSAECYGPSVDYTNHPDAGGMGNDDGELPHGDLGLWTDTEEGTTEACAAAQLNARMQGVSEKASSAMQILASMICTINNTSGMSIPAAGSSVSMATEMNAMLTAAAVTTVTVNTATLSAATNAEGTTDYSYAINLTAAIVDPLDATVTTNTTIQIDMTHRPLDATNATFRGEFSYYLNGRDDTAGNCNREFGALNTAEVTELGSVVYEHASATSVKVDARYAQACGHANNTALVSGVLDPSVKAVTDIEPGDPSLTGWAANFSIMKGDFDPADGQGSYTFGWQAGVGDGTARTFNLVMDDADSDTLRDAVAFFGFGDDIEDSDGSIEGMYCNWAGPGGGVGNQTSKRQDLVQRQAMEENTSTQVFEMTSSLITYAPTLDCNVDTSDVAGGFTYDIDANGTADPAAILTHELVSPTDVTNGITASGFTLPTSPTGP